MLEIQHRDYRGTRLVIGTDKNRIFFDSDYDPTLVKEIKQMAGAKWYGHKAASLKEYVFEHFKTDKVWSVKNNERNQWALSYLLGEDPYSWYKRPIDPVSFHNYPLLKHQQSQSEFVVARRRCLIASDMGLGKTLAIIAAWDHIKPDGLVYISELGVIRNTREQEFPMWNPAILPDQMLSYGSIHKVKNVPQMVVFDEAHNLKGATSVRSANAQLLAKQMREEWGDDAYIVGLTGSTAPQDPTDWYAIMELLCPGYLVEGDVHKFRRRLAVMQTTDYGNGPVQEVRTWKDRTGIEWCSDCGRTKEDHPVKKGLSPYKDCLRFRECKNEVVALNKRLDNKIVLFQKFEDHCVLPPLQYKTIQCTPLQEHIDVAKGLAAVAEGGADMLNKCRQISDGGVYTQKVVGMEKCQACGGTGESVGLMPISDELPPLPDSMSHEEYMERYYHDAVVECDVCLGGGEAPKYERTVQLLETPSPKIAALTDLFDQHVKHRRLVVYAAFQFSVDLCRETAEAAGWDWIQADGRGWKTSLDFVDKPRYLSWFQDVDFGDKPIGFIAQPGAAGSGLTLHASPSIVNYSMTYNTKDRVQARKRIHRIGSPHDEMSIFDLYNMPTDKLINDAVKVKEARMDMSNGVDIDMNAILESLK